MSTSLFKENYTKSTPMMEQYLHFKSLHPDKFVFFRLGDFYELFLDDASKAAAILGITLTQRDGKPMCGIPHHQLYVYAAKLVAQGKKVVVVDQTTNNASQLAKNKEAGTKNTAKIIHREITEIITPGTTHEWNTLPGNQNNFLLSLTAWKDDFLGLPQWVACIVDVSTGEVEIIDWGLLSERAASERILTMNIRELVIDEGTASRSFTDLLTKTNSHLVINTLAANTYSTEPASLEQTLAKYYPAYNKELFLFKLKKQWEISTHTPSPQKPPAAARKTTDDMAADYNKLKSYQTYLKVLVQALHYASTEQHREFNHLKLPTLIRRSDYLVLDSIVIRNLELFRNNYDGSTTHTLLATLDKTQTPMGTRLLRRSMLQPLANKRSLAERLDRVNWFYNNPTFLEIFRKTLYRIPDIERLLGRLGLGRLLPSELRTLTKALRTVSTLWQSFLTHMQDEAKEESLTPPARSHQLLPPSEKIAPAPPPTSTQASAKEKTFEQTLSSLDRCWEGEGFYALKEFLYAESSSPSPRKEEPPQAAKDTASIHTDLNLTSAALLKKILSNKEKSTATSPNSPVQPAATHDPSREATTLAGSAPAQAEEIKPAPHENPSTKPTLGLAFELFSRAELFFSGMYSRIDKQLLAEPQNDFIEGGVIRETTQPKLKKLHDQKRQLYQNLSELWQKEKTKTGISTLKLKYTENLGYFFEVTQMYLKNIPAYFQRKRTLKGSERFITIELLDLEKKVREVVLQIVETERQLYHTLLLHVRHHIDVMQRMAVALGYLDVWSTFAHLALKHRYVRPHFISNAAFIYQEGRHPVIEQLENEPFVANSLAMNKQTSVLHIVTGPNMAGKSTFLRQTALIVIMAHMGCFVPAQSIQLPVFDRIFTRIGASDRLAKGESTFLVEMNETAEILNHATHNSLVIMDEIGRGTSTYDGLAIAWSILEYLTQNKHKRPYTLFATHYHEITALTAITGVENYTLNIKEEGTRLLFLRRVIKGAAGRSYGVHVARLAGLPQAIILKARERLRYFEQQHSIPPPQNLTASEQSAASTPYFSETAFNNLEQRFEKEHGFLLQVKRSFENLDIDKLTPLQGLQKLADLKKKFEERY